MFNWSTDQLAAISEKNADLLVAAAAGSGKTAVLVERIIRTIIYDKIDIDKLLIVTFTNAATSEMKQRISKAIVNELSNDYNNKHLQKQLTLLNRASIMTIDSFCLSIVRQYFNVVDIDPSFRIADETELSLIKTDTIEQLFEQLYEQNDSDFLKLVETFGKGTTDTALQNLVLKVYSFVQSSPYPERWLSEMPNAYKINESKISKTKWGVILKSVIESQIDYAIERCQYAIKLAELPDGPHEYVKALTNDLDILYAVKMSDDFFTSVYVAQASRLSNSKCADKDLKERVKAIRDNDVKGIIDELKKKYCFKPEEDILKDISDTYPTVKSLTELVKLFSNEYEKAKKLKCIVDFSDVAHYCLNILCSESSTEENIIQTAISKELSQRYHEIYIDEYQDSNYIQEMILTSVSGYFRSSPNRFMVGDVKQSIYKFRQAAPELFIQKYMSFKSTGNQIRIDLSQNFRSRSNVVEGINKIFYRLMSEQVGEINYDDKAALYAGAVFPESSEANITDGVEIIALHSDCEIDDESEIAEIGKVEFEADIVAARINEIMSGEINVYDSEEKKYRKPQFKDIVILLRTANKRGQDFANRLIKYGIDAATDSSTGFYDTVEIKTILSLLQIIDNPRQDIPLITVLYSPIQMLNGDDLAAIRSLSRETAFYDCILLYIEKYDDELSEKLSSFLDDIYEYRRLSILMPTSELVNHVLTHTDYYNIVGLLPGGAIRQANLDLFKEKAHAYEKTSYFGLFNFIKFIERIQKHDTESGEAKFETLNAVRIMSIHKSKGLEFPIVFVSGLGNNFNLQDSRASVLLHQKLGLGVDLFDYEKRVKRNTIVKHLIAKKIMQENLSEEMRVLYVAMTRAKEKLILTGIIDKDITDFSERKNIPPHYLLKSKSFLEWIMPAAHDFKILHKTKADLELQQETKRKLQSFDFSKNENSLSDMINQKYIFERETEIPSKISISEIKKVKYTDENTDNFYGSKFELSLPSFVEHELTSAEKGTVIHCVLRHINLYETNVLEYLKSLVMRGLLTEKEASCVDVSKVETFLQSDICSRMRKSEKIYREQPFVLGLNPSDIYDISLESDDNMLVHGIIDCFFKEEGGYVLLDFKTDKKFDYEEIQKRYSIQLSVYKHAVERFTGENVIQTIVYMFDHSDNFILNV